MPNAVPSAGDLLQLFRARRARTRAEVQHLTGLARSTVTYKVDALVSAGYLIEDGRVIDGRGRPATRLRVNDRGLTILAADLGATHGRLAVATAAGEVLAETVIESSIGNGPTAVLSTVHQELAGVLARTGRRSGTVRGVAVGVPGPVDASGAVARSISMPGWDRYPLREHLAERYRVPAAVENDANLLGLGEQRRVYPGVHQLVFVKVGTGIGAAVLVDGQLLRGSRAAEGDIGHAKVFGVTEVCASCGARGCLAAVASGRALVRDLRRAGRRVRTSREVVDLVRAGDAEAVRLLTGAGRHLGDVLSTAVSLLNPDVVVIGGDIAGGREHLLQGVRETLFSRSQPLAAAGLRVESSQLGDRAGIIGAAELLSDAIFSPIAVDAALHVRSGPSVADV